MKKFNFGSNFLMRLVSAVLASMVFLPTVQAAYPNPSDDDCFECGLFCGAENGGEFDLDGDATIRELALADACIQHKKGGANMLFQMRLLFSKGANVNCKMFGGSLLQHVILLGGDAEAVEFLLNKGARIDECDRNDRTALMFAVMVHNAAVVKLLLDRGAKVDKADKDGHTALFFARQNKSFFDSLPSADSESKMHISLESRGEVLNILLRAYRK